MAGPATRRVTREAVLAFRLRRHQLDEPAGGGRRSRTDVDLLDFGVQDTGPDGAGWALALRGLQVQPPDDMVVAWTLRGAPHWYRRRDITEVMVATAPLSEADAAHRIFDAAKPLRASGRPVLASLAEVAAAMRDIVAKPTPKGEVSGQLTDRLDAAFLRTCRPCGTTHIYEMPFRLAALQGGLSLQPSTSPPVLQRLARVRPPLFGRPGTEAGARFDVVRNALRFYGPIRVADVSTFIDAPQRDVQSRWPEDAVPVEVQGEAASARSKVRFALAADVEELTDGDAPADRVLLLGPFDPYLQLRDRSWLVHDEARRKDLWRTIGRPGAVLQRGEVIGTWRPRSRGRSLAVAVTPWRRLPAPVKAAIEEQAERLAEWRGVAAGPVSWD